MQTRLRVQIIAFTLARTVLNTGQRMVYPFLPTFARGLGVDLETVALAVTARSGLGLISPVFGSLADRRGRKFGMMTGLLLFAGGMSLVLTWPTVPALFAALILGGMGKLIYDPAMQATIGDRVPYTRRGMVIAITELSWSGAFLLGMPVIGWLIARSDHWYAPFPLLAVLGMFALVIIGYVVPSDGESGGNRPSLAQGMRLIMSHTPALAGLGMSFLINGSNEIVSIVYGAWMEDAFALKVTALGTASVVIGIAELTSEFGVAGWVDRIGKRRAVALGLASNALACLLLPVLGFSLASALVGLFVFFLTFEFALVSSIPLMTELVPGARATLMAGNVAALSIGRMVGALLGPQLFKASLLANGATAAIFDVAALALLVMFIRQE
ncbi:MAG: MFS transporter [Anaerolineae bacterium]|nr:MFS transporter [Anaerolineae bacterium]